MLTSFEVVISFYLYRRHFAPIHIISITSYIIEFNVHPHKFTVCDFPHVISLNCWFFPRSHTLEEHARYEWADSFTDNEATSKKVLIM